MLPKCEVTSSQFDIHCKQRIIHHLGLIVPEIVHKPNPDDSVAVESSHSKINYGRGGLSTLWLFFQGTPLSMTA